MTEWSDPSRVAEYLLRWRLPALSVLVLVALALFAPAAQARKPAQTSIIGGSVAPPEAWPWAAFITALDEEGNGFACSGTVVSPNVVLTAGHCVEDLSNGQITPASEYTVVTGAADVNGPTKQVSGASQVIVNPRFSRSTAHGDVGLVVLSTPTSAPAIPLATSADASLLRPRARVSIAGWGLTSGGAQVGPTSLRQAVTYVQGPAYCSRHVGAYYPFFSSSTQFCASKPPNFSVGTCHGDSGGPVVAQRPDGTLVEVGVTSLVGEDCAPSLPDVFTRVDRVSTWVNGWIAALAPGSTSPPPSTSGSPSHRLPTMRKAEALTYVRRALQRDFGATFGHNRIYRVKCQRIASERLRCAVVWIHGRNVYYGYVTVFYVFNREAVSWNDRYTIHWVDESCVFESAPSRSCTIHTRRK